MAYLTVRQNVLDCKKRHYKISDLERKFRHCLQVDLR